MQANSPVINNKKAGFEYHILHVYEAGLVLTGSEVKALRAAKANMSDAYAAFDGEKLQLKNLHISLYDLATYNNHEPKRSRLLLLKKAELRKIKVKLKDKGITMVPLKLFFNERGFAKVTIGLAKGKKLYDKRDDLKTKDAKREVARRDAE